MKSILLEKPKTYTDGTYVATETTTETSRYGTFSVKYTATVKLETKDWGYGTGAKQYGTLTVLRNGICVQSGNGLTKDFLSRLEQMTKT